MKFKNKKAIVTGANRSIGRSIAIALATEGADVVISYRSDEAGARDTIEEIKKLGRNAQAIYVDFSKNENITAFANKAIEFLGHIDLLVNNAGMVCRESFFETTPETMQTVLQINTIAPFYLMQLCAKNMIDKKISGSIVNISSIAAFNTQLQRSAYGASKAALNKLTQNAALEVAKYNIRVNTVCPGVIHSGMNEDTAESNPELWAEYLKKIPLQRAGTPTDIANMVLFLLSDDANWITGKIFTVDGGHVL